MADMDTLLRTGWRPTEAGLIEHRPGLWIEEQLTALSYPDGGNDACYQVEARSFWFQHRNACIAAVTKRLPPSGVFADVGGGNGFVARALETAGLDVALIEPGPAGAMHAWERGVRPVIRATLAQAGFPHGSLGGIGVFDVVEHIEDDIAFLTDLRRHLSSTGRLYVTVPAFQLLWSAEDESAGHFRRYSQHALRRTLASAGFEVEYLSALFAWLPLPVFLARSLPSRLGFRSATDDHAAGEHILPANIAGRMLTRALELERDAVAKGRVLPVGGSLIAVARPRATLRV
jgi:SAM-dependent methyltransferase